VLSILSASIAFAPDEARLFSQKPGAVAGTMSVVAALIMGLHTWLRLGERAEVHRGLAAKYATTRRRIELLKAFPPATLDEFRRELGEIQQRLDEHARGAPETPWWSKWRTDRELKREGMKNRWSELCGDGTGGDGCPCQRLRNEAR